MIDVATAAKLLDFGARIGTGQRSQEQLEGAVAIHNILSDRGIAYLADEVGMGKTYVALGALALFRHYKPDFRVLVIAPRENIQDKWMKELRNFVAHNVRFADLRVKALDGRPTKALVACGNLIDLVREVTTNTGRDIFLRLSSFSLPVTGTDTVDADNARRLRDGLRNYLPWVRDEVFDLRSKQAFKDNVARVLCCALPRFDLVIVDEGHNLKHGFGENVAARNRVLALAMGHSRGGADPRLFPGFGPRAKRVLFLSATPVEETYRQLWNQLDVFGLGGPFDGLRSADLDEETKKGIARQFLVRRVTSIRVGDQEYTKNLYRREWRRGGVHIHDEPIRVQDPKQRLIVALVQKKVSELLAHERFNSSFQIGMLASFESFLQTARLKRDVPEGEVFDDKDQTDDPLEREGIDVADVNRMASSYQQKFGLEMPHPKMDALVESLSNAWKKGEKALVFVRRVASVKELKKKLEELYDAWLIGRLKNELPVHLHERLAAVFEQYRADKQTSELRKEHAESADQTQDYEANADRGGRESFFAWFFRGEGPRGIVSGANIQRRFIQKGTAYATFFADNYVATLLSVEPGQVATQLAKVLGISQAALRKQLRERAKRFLTRARRHGRADLFEASQAAAMEWLKDHAGPYQEGARLIWHERFESAARLAHAVEAPDIIQWLELRTFFTELRARDELRSRLWPVSQHPDPLDAFREQELRAQLLSSTARLGHSLIDLYVLTIRRLGTLELRAQETDEDGTDIEADRINEYLDLLDAQMRMSRDAREWGAFDELADGAMHFNLIVDVNEPGAPFKPVGETASLFGTLLGQQQPVGGMSGEVNKTLVRQFRMPGYPLVLVTTDLLQEGEDLHTFCSTVHHYGISWTPSSMEQRIGRIDRVRSQTEFRLSAIRDRPLKGEDMLQVYFPHLEDTVEILQVQRVLERMNVFLRLMHEGLTTAGREERTIDAGKELVRGRRDVPQIRERLVSAFPVSPEHTKRGTGQLEVGPDLADTVKRRFASLTNAPLSGIEVVWEPQNEPTRLFGTARLTNSRIQPFSLLLRSVGLHPVVRCISPVGSIGPDQNPDALVATAEASPIHIGAIRTSEDRTYDVTVEGDVILVASDEHNATRVAMLIQRVVQLADAVEQEHLPGQDEVLGTFRAELSQEGVG